VALEHMHGFPRYNARAILVPVPSVLTAQQEKSAAKIIREAVGC
jgi:vacuolar-type H+-ATPase subunit F/Vma7